MIQIILSGILEPSRLVRDLPPQKIDKEKPYNIKN